MIGVRNRKRGLFGAQPTIGTPGIGEEVERERSGGLPQMPAGVGMQSPEPKKRSFLPYALAAVEDTLSRQMGYAPQGVARLNAVQAQQQQAAAEMAAEQRKRSIEWADWQRKEQWKRDNPAPVNNDTERDIELMRGMLPPEQFEQYLQNNYINPTFYTGADGRRYPNPTMNRPAIGAVVADPRKQGGTVSNGGGGF